MVDGGSKSVDMRLRVRIRKGVLLYETLECAAVAPSELALAR